MTLTDETADVALDGPDVPFSDRAWRSVSGWFDKIISHPFITELASGTLDEAVFARYLLDDAHYLGGYASALASLSARAEDPDGRVLLARSAAAAIEAERAMHRGYLLPRGVDPDAADAPEPSPTCVGYVETLRATSVLKPLAVGVAAILPCFRVYAEVGAWIVDRSDPDPDHPYRGWIDTYADPAFAESVREAEAYTDRLAARATTSAQDAMLTAYQQATRFEYMFWDAAWQNDRWPKA
jgi:thiaminase/transcriptional activator TenA